MKSLRNEIQRTSLLKRVNNLSGDQKPLWGKMSIDQMMSHLVQAGELPFEPSLPDKSSFASRNFIKPLILYVLPMPKEVKVSPEMNQQEKGRKPLGFEKDRQLLIESITRLGDLPADHKCSYHPMFGKMSAREWALIAHKHIDHHLRQFGV
jgi:hypothetical protein